MAQRYEKAHGWLVAAAERFSVSAYQRELSSAAARTLGINTVMWVRS
jgi:hypothetical protein